MLAQQDFRSFQPRKTFEPELILFGIFDLQEARKGGRPWTV